MATLSDSGFPNLANIASRLDPDGSGAYVANVLSQKNPVLEDIPWVEGNLATGHQVTQAVNALPSATWRKLNSGVVSTKAETAQYIESCGILEDESIIDEAVAELNGGAEYRQSEDELKMEALSQQFTEALFYESTTTNPERIHGLAPRYPSTTGFVSSAYTFAGTNSGTNCHSIWLICWSPRKCYGIYPKATMAGLERNDMGKRRILDSNNNAFYAWTTQLKWRVGVAVEDYRYVVRFQWDPDDAFMADEDRGIYLNMIEMLVQIYDAEGAIFYMNRTSMTQLNQQLAANDVNYLTYIDRGGRNIPAFQGHPIRVVDGLVAESSIS